MKPENNRVLFVSRFVAHAHYYESILEALLARGYHVRLLLSWSANKNKEGYLDPLLALRRQYPLFEVGWVRMRSGAMHKCAIVLRNLRSYRMYDLMPSQSAYYRDRAAAALPPLLRAFALSRIGSRFLRTKKMGAFLAWCEALIPPSRLIARDIERFAPAVVVATPTNMQLEIEVSDLEYLKAAKALGIPTVIPLINWDNLTTKGLLQIAPDRLLVWNEDQKKDAVAIHAIAPERIRVTGASVFDQWFGRREPFSSREQFCAAHGLDPERPFVAYLGSSQNISGDESWLAEKASEAAAAAGASFLVRPHPANAACYRSFAARGGIVVPSEGQMPNNAEAFALFFDTLFHSALVLGVNTSGMIEAAIADRPIIALTVPRYRATQTQAVHFGELLAHGALETVSNLDELSKIVRERLSGADPSRNDRQAFVRSFVRPCGIDRPAGENAALEIIDLIRDTHYN